VKIIYKWTLFTFMSVPKSRYYRFVFTKQFCTNALHSLLHHLSLHYIYSL
jgi:hypothetical protein